jgi:hypothetical protein
MIEIVFASDEVSKNAHWELYRLDEQAYIIITDDLIETITQFRGDPHRLHVSSNWADITSLAVWKSEPKAGDVLFLLRSMGITSEELFPFRDAGIADLFPWLYYGKRVDVLRKICLVAKANVEKHIENKELRIHCHLTSEETNRIVASSL